MKFRVVCAAALLAVAFPVFANAQEAHGVYGTGRMSPAVTAKNEKSARIGMKSTGKTFYVSSHDRSAETMQERRSLFSMLAPRNSGAATGNASSASYNTIISRYARSYGVPVNLAHAIIRIESNYRANARGRAGEIGLMQIKLSTARMMGYSGSRKGLYNPETNLKYGMKYLAMAHNLGGGSTCGTVLKYNAGHGAKRMNRVSSRYCAKVKRQLKGA
jgi:soluble lytic murein transglycosylase-like protein